MSPQHIPPLVLATLALAASAVLAARCIAAPPQAAFLDSPTQINLRLPVSTKMATLTGHVSVTCGDTSVAVVRVVAAPEETGGASEVVLAGNFQSALGGSDWQPDDPRTRMQEAAPGVYDLALRLPAGNYAYKVTRGGNWAQNWGAGFQPAGANLTLAVPRTGWVRFRVDFNQRTVQASLGVAAPAPAAPRARSAQDITLILGQSLGPSDIVRPMTVRLPDGAVCPVYARDVLSGSDYVYHGDDLGVTYTPLKTTFKVWCPVASSASVLLYAQASGGSPRTLPLRRGAAGVWSGTTGGDLNGVYYQYQFITYGAVHTGPDLYGRAASPDLRRSMVVDLARTNPPGWASVPSPPLTAPTDAVVYELHLRDFTGDPSSGVPAVLRGKYLGLVAPGTTVPGTNVPTGLDYLSRLGVTHVQVMPFQSISSGSLSDYTWGYATDLFNVPEPRYATDPSDPAGVIRQVKEMVVGLHRAHVGLVMDVVYNHSVPASGEDSPFWATVPYYYFRTDFGGALQNESGVGNALDDERPMVRKFIQDSLVYWATQYHVDGFRFDLLGMFTPQTVAALSNALHQARPDILLYGEPWTGGGPVRFGKGAQRGLGIGVFNDNFRNNVRGDLNGTGRGFALGGGARMKSLQTLIAGSPDFAAAPGESVNYVSIHDDLTLWDKIHKALPEADEATDRQMLKFAGAVTLLSQGAPVLEGGAELGRTKEGVSDSYAGGDAENRFDWRRGLAFQDVAAYYQALIALRRAHPAFRCASAAAVRQTLAFLPPSQMPPDTVAFTLNGAAAKDSWHRILVVFHGDAQAAALPLPSGAWKAALSGTAPLPGRPLLLAPLTAYVFYQE